MILHTVVFKTKHKNGSVEERRFLEAGKALSKIPTVLNFQCLKQVSKKNKFEFGFTMEFKSQHDYDAYNEHPDHVKFVEIKWKTEVEDFLEIDYVPIS